VVWVANAQIHMSRSLTLQAPPAPPPWVFFFSAAGRCGRPSAPVDSGKAQTNPNPAFEFPSGERQASESQKQRSQSRHSWAPAGQRRPMAILKDNDVASRPADIEALRRAARTNAKELRGEQTKLRQRKPSLAQRLDSQCPKSRGRSSRGGKRNPNATARHS